MDKKVVCIYNDKNELIEVLEVKTIEDVNTLVSMRKLAAQNKEKDITEKQNEQATKELALNKILKDFENRLKLLEIEQKYNRGEISYSEYTELLKESE